MPDDWMTRFSVTPLWHIYSDHTRSPSISQVPPQATLDPTLAAAQWVLKLNILAAGIQLCHGICRWSTRVAGWVPDGSGAKPPDQQAVCVQAGSRTDSGGIYSVPSIVHPAYCTPRYDPDVLRAGHCPQFLLLEEWPTYWLSGGHYVSTVGLVETRRSHRLLTKSHERPIQDRNTVDVRLTWILE